jgi:NTE family protein
MQLLFRRPSLFHRKRLESVIYAMAADVQFEDLSLPLHVVALDLDTGEEVVVKSGNVRQALVASCSVAGFFPPLELDGKTLIDSGQSDNLPVSIAAEIGDRPIVSVNLSKDLEGRAQYTTGIEIMFRSDEIGSHWNNRLREQQADVALAPNLGGRYWLDFSDLEEVIEAGAEATRQALPEIRACLQQPRKPTGSLRHVS